MNLPLGKLIGGVVLIFSAQVASGSKATTACRLITLDPAPTWVNSMTWSPDEREVIIGDIPNGRLLRFAKEGRFLGAIGPQKTTIGEYGPLQVHTTRDGFMIRSRAYEWFEFDRNFKFLRSFEPNGRPQVAMFDEVLAGNEVIGFGTARKPDNTWAFGIQRVRLSPLQVIETLGEMPLDSKAGTLYTSLSPEVALANGIPYVLRFDEPSYLWNVKTHRSLKAFPQGFGNLPVLQAVNGPDSDVPRERVLEKSTMPMAVYGSSAFLFVLTRRPGSDGKSVWELHRIDPVKDLLAGSVILPTSASALTLAPGKESWAILEKGPLTASGKQEIRRLLLVPTAAIETGSGKISCP